MRLLLIIFAGALAFAQTGVMRVQRRAATVPSVTELCATTTTPCTVTASAPTGALVVACEFNLGGAMTTPTSAGNTFAQDYDHTDGTTGLHLTCWSSVLASGLTSGSSTLAFPGIAFSAFAVVLNNLGAKTFDVDAAQFQNFTAAYDSGATSATTGVAGCLGIATLEGSSSMSSAGSGFAITNASVGVVSLRNMAYEFGPFASGVPVTATATLSAAAYGVMQAVCYK